jgi:hypothetical protein
VELEFLKRDYNPVIDIAMGSANFLPPQFLLDALVEVSKNWTAQGSYEIHQYPTWQVSQTAHAQ